MYVYGKNVANEIIENDRPIVKVFISDNFNDDKIIKNLQKKNVDIKKISRTDMDNKVSGLHQGIILEVPNYKYAQLEDILYEDNSFIVILDHIEDPHNFGAIIRTCEAAGVSGIIIPDDRSVDVNSTVVKTSVGTTDKVKIVRVKNLVNTIDKMKKDGFWIFGTDMDGSDYSTLDYSGKIAIICGNEGKGMSRLVKDKCDFIASIPMAGTVNSLNASVATAIIVFEAKRIRGL